MKRKRVRNPSYYFFIFCTLFISCVTVADVNFSSGYAVVDGVPKRILQAIYPETIIVCDPTCIIVSGDKKIRIDYPGFGTLEKMCKVASPQTSVDHLVASLNGKIDFKI